VVGEIGSGSLSLNNLGSRRREKKQTDRCIGPAQDMAYDKVDARIQQGVLILLRERGSPDQAGG
jgi:hypothetical protein